MNKGIKYFLLWLPVFLCSFSAEAQTETTEKLAYQYLHNQEYDKAADLFEVLFNSNPNPLYYSSFFDCLMQLEDYKRAIKFLNKQTKRFPYNPKYAVDLGYVYIKSGDESAGIKQFENALKNVPLDRDAYVELANAFLMRNQVEFALKTYLKGKKMLKGSYPLNMELAEVYMKTGNFAGALNEYLELLETGYQSQEEIQNRLQDILAYDPDNSRNETFKTELLARIKKYPDRIFYPELLLWHFIQRKEFDAAFIQAKSLDKRLNEEGTRVFKLGKLAADNRDYDAAIECFNYIISKGEVNPYWFSARIELMNARYNKITQSYSYTQEDIRVLEKEYEKVLNELGKNAQTLSLINNLAHIKAFYLSKTEEAIALLQNALNMPGAKPTEIAEVKLELADILLMSGEVWEATLLYSQVEKAFKNEPIGAEAKFRNAKLSFYIGEFEWARAQLDVLRAATSKLIANDAMQLSLLITDNMGEDSTAPALRIFARADLLLFQKKDEEALKTLDSISLITPYDPLFDDVLYKKAEIMLLKRKYAEADTLLRKLYENYPDDILGDDALFKLAQLQENVFGNRQKAMELYKELLEKYPGSLYVMDARKRYRLLRGDNPNP